MATIDVDIFTLTGASRTTTAATVNGLTVDATNPSSIATSVANIEAAADSDTASDVDPGTSGSDVLITINANVTRAIDSEFFGFNLHRNALYASGGDLFDLTDSTFLALVNLINPGLIRWPGGSVRTYWDSTNTQDRDTPPGGYNEVLRADDLLSLVTFCSNTGATLLLPFNVGFADEADYQSLATHIGNQGYTNISFFGGGNEPDLNGISQAAYVTSWESYYDDIRAIDSSWQFGAPESNKTSILDNGVRAAYTDGVLSDLQSDGYDVALVCGHVYPLWGANPNPGWSTYPTLANLLGWGPDIWDNRGYLSYFDNWVQELVAMRDEYHPSARVMLTEFGPSTGVAGGIDEQEIFHSIGTALWLASVVGLVSRRGCDGLLFYPMMLPYWRANSSYTNMLFWSNLGYLYPGFYVYLMFGQWWGDSWIMDISSDDEANVGVTASVDDDYMYVMLINKTAGNSYDVHVTFTYADTNYYLTNNIGAHSIVLYRVELPTAGTITPTDNFDYWLTNRLATGVA